MKIFTFLMLFAIPYFCSSQNKTRIGAFAEYSENFNSRNISGGLNLELLIGNTERFALNYKFNAGASSDKAFYFHSTLGGFAGGFILSKLGNTGFEAVNTLGFFLCFVPEGVTFYPNPESKLSPGFYINPLGSDYWFKKNNYETFKVSGELGGKIMLNHTEKFAIQGHVGLKYLYGPKTIEPLFITAGIGILFTDL